MTTSKFGFPLFVLACALVCTLAFRGNATAGDTETLGWNFAEGSHPQPYTHISQQEAATLVAQDFEEGDSAPSAAGEKSARNEHDVWLDRVRKNSDIVRGKASWYGRDFDARPTASGLPYDMYTFTGAHRTLPIGTVVRVSDQYNGKSVMVCVTDRGPFVHGRIIDLSYAAANSIGLETKGVSDVGIEVVSDANGVPLSRDEAFYVQLENPADGDKIGPYDSFADAAAMHEAMLSAHPEARVVLDRKK